MNTLSANIFDDSNIFIGDSGIVNPESSKVDKPPSDYSHIKERSLCQSHLLNVINNWCPLGREAEKRWRDSEQSQRWHQSWQFLQHLTTEGYIMLFGSFPSPFLKHKPTGRKSREVYDNFQDNYRTDALWMLKLLRFDVPKPAVLDIPQVKEREIFGQLNQAELLLCQAYLNHKESRQIFRDMFRHEANLWFWLQAARCKHLCQKHGLIEPLYPYDISTKGRFIKDWGEDLARLAEKENAKPTNNSLRLGDCPDFLLKLPTLFYREVQRVASVDEEFRDSSLAAYRAISHTARNKINRSGDYQTEFLYVAPSSDEVEIYQTGRTNKRPTSKSRRRKGFAQ